MVETSIKIHFMNIIDEYDLLKNALRDWEIVIIKIQSAISYSFSS